jgi:hypothetical protein
MSVEQDASMLTYHKACSYILQTQTRVQSHVLNISQTPRIVHVGEIGSRYFANIYLRYSFATDVMACYNTLATPKMLRNR